jgi:hypothetical protein
LLLSVIQKAGVRNACQMKEYLRRFFYTSSSYVCSFYRWKTSTSFQNLLRGTFANLRDFRLPPRRKCVLFWDIMQRRMVVPYRRFGTTFPSPLQGPSSPRRMLRCPETSIQEYQSTLCRIPKQRASHFADLFVQTFSSHLSLLYVRYTDGCLEAMQRQGTHRITGHGFTGKVFTTYITVYQRLRK